MPLVLLRKVEYLEFFGEVCVGVCGFSNQLFLLNQPFVYESLPDFMWEVITHLLK